MKFDIDILKTGYFMLYANDGSFFGNQIEKAQLRYGIPASAAKYVHVEVLGPKQWSINVNPPRAKVVDITKQHKGRRACMVRYNADDFDAVRVYIAWWAVSHNNLRYDYLGVLKFLIGAIWHDKNLFFCSENCAWALRKYFPFAFGKVETHRIMPGHFLNSEFEVVWEGVIGE